ncbi:enoyl-CoA hydratase-related protein [Sphingobium ummariense]
MTAMKLKRDGPVAILTLDRPAAMNPLGAAGDGETVRALCDEINSDLSIRSVILTGEGKAFCAGGDVKAIADPAGAFAGSALKIRDYYQANIHRLALALRGVQVPLIAAVNGAAIGLGCDVACMADIRLAGRSAKFGATFLKLGLVPGDGGSWLLPRIIGASRASELFYTGKIINAQTAHKWGLVSEVLDDDALPQAALALAKQVASMPSHSLRLTKMLIRQGEATGYDQALQDAALAQAISHATPDHREGVAAVIEKREPQFNR